MRMVHVWVIRAYVDLDLAALLCSDEGVGADSETGE
jgi:hypothetical protein